MNRAMAGTSLQILISQNVQVLDIIWHYVQFLSLTNSVIMLPTPWIHIAAEYARRPNWEYVFLLLLPVGKRLMLNIGRSAKKGHFSSVLLAMCMHANLAKCSAILLDFWQTLAVFSCFLSCCGRGAGRNKNPSASCYHRMSGHFWLRCHNSPKYRAVEININSKTISNPLQWLPPHCVVGLWWCFQILHDARSLLHVCCKQYLRILFSLFEKQSDSFEHNTDCNSNHARKVSTAPGAFVSCSAQSCVFFTHGRLAVFLVQVLTSFTPYALEPSWHRYDICVAIQQLVQQIVPNSSIAQFLIHLSAVFVFLCLHHWGFIIGMCWWIFAIVGRFHLESFGMAGAHPLQPMNFKRLWRPWKNTAEMRKKTNRTKKTNKHRVWEKPKILRQALLIKLCWGFYGVAHWLELEWQGTDPQTKTNLLFKTKTRHCHIVPHCHVVREVANQHRLTKHTTYFSPTNNKRESLLL